MYFRGLADGANPKGPEKARKKPLKYWFDAFFGTRKLNFGASAEGGSLVYKPTFVGFAGLCDRELVSMSINIAPPRKGRQL